MPGSVGLDRDELYSMANVAVPRSAKTCALLLLASLTVACDDKQGDPEGGDAGGDTADLTETTGGASTRTYLLEIPPENWSEPAGIGSEIGAFVPKFLFRVDEADGTVLLGTATSDDVQDPCNPTVEASLEGEQVGPVAFPVHLVDAENDITVDATIHELQMTSVLPDGSQDGEFSAVMDLQELYPLFVLVTNPTPDTICAALDSFGAPCEPCPFDESSKYCLTLRAVALEASAASDIEMRAIPSGGDASCSE